MSGIIFLLNNVLVDYKVFDSDNYYQTFYNSQRNTSLMGIASYRYNLFIAGFFTDMLACSQDKDTALTET